MRVSKYTNYSKKYPVAVYKVKSILPKSIIFKDKENKDIEILKKQILYSKMIDWKRDFSIGTKIGLEIIFPSSDLSKIKYRQKKIITSKTVFSKFLHPTKNGFKNLKNHVLQENNLI